MQARCSFLLPKFGPCLGYRTSACNTGHRSGYTVDVWIDTDWSTLSSIPSSECVLSWLLAGTDPGLTQEALACNTSGYHP